MFKQFLKQITEQNILQIFTLVKARETQQLFTINRYHCPRPPSLSVTIKQNAREQPIAVGHDVRVVVSFRNILPSSMSHAVFLIEGMGSYKEMSHRYVFFSRKYKTKYSELLLFQPPGMRPPHTSPMQPNFNLRHGLVNWPLAYVRTS